MKKAVVYNVIFWCVISQAVFAHQDGSSQLLNTHKAAVVTQDNDCTSSSESDHKSDASAHVSASAHKMAAANCKDAHQDLSGGAIGGIATAGTVVVGGTATGVVVSVNKARQAARLQAIHEGKAAMDRQIRKQKGELTDEEETEDLLSSPSDSANDVDFDPYAAPKLGNDLDDYEDADNLNMEAVEGQIQGFQGFHGSKAGAGGDMLDSDDSIVEMTI